LTSQSTLTETETLTTTLRLIDTRVPILVEEEQPKTKANRETQSSKRVKTPKQNINEILSLTIVTSK